MPWPGALPRMCIRGNAPVVPRNTQLTLKNEPHSLKLLFRPFWGPNKNLLSQDGYHVTTQYILVNGQIRVYFSRASFYFQIKKFLAVCVASDSNVENEA
jgi:hypothetical protein